MEAGGLSSLTTGQVRGRRSGTEHADLPVITGRLFLGLPVGVRAEATESLCPESSYPGFNGAHAGTFFFLKSTQGLHRGNQLTVANGNRDICFSSDGFNPFTHVLGTVVGREGGCFHQRYSTSLNASMTLSDYFPSLPKKCPE